MFIIGGAEEKAGEFEPDIALNSSSEYERFEILKHFVSNTRHTQGIEIITTASEVPDEIKKIYDKTFKKLGYKNINFLNIQDKLEAKDKKNIKRIHKTSAVLFTGGDQFRISTILGGTAIAEAILDKYLHDKDFIVAGTSAGAMVMSRIMISGGGVNEALLKGDLLTSSGLGLLEQCIVDTHFIKRGRFGRLAHAIIMNPEHLGIGLGEDTALIISRGTEAECWGSGMVVIIDGKDILQTNVTDVNEAEALFVENMRVHLLVKGCRFSLKDREFTKPSIRKDKKH